MTIPIQNSIYMGLQRCVILFRFIYLSILLNLNFIYLSILCRCPSGSFIESNLLLRVLRVVHVDVICCSPAVITDNISDRRYFLRGYYLINVIIWMVFPGLLNAIRKVMKLMLRCFKIIFLNSTFDQNY